MDGMDPKPTQRLHSVDALRGLIMALMAIDHVSLFIARAHPGEFWGRPLPEYPTVLAFLTRLVTHLCAPGFFFLMGAGMILLASSRRRLGWSEARITRFLAVRGLLLIVLNHVLENFAWLLGLIGAKTEINTYGHTGPPGGGGDAIYVMFSVLYGLGACMIICSLLLRLRSSVLAALALVTVFLTQLLTPSPESVDTLYSPVLRLLLIPGQSGSLLVMYPAIPWLGFTLLGLVFGKALYQDHRQAFRHGWIWGTGFLVAFLALRTAGGFGNLHSPGDDNWIDFLNVTKYPPSLTFLLLTLGVNLILMATLEKAREYIRLWGRPLLVFGRTALFFYFAHLYLYALAGFAFPMGTSIPAMYVVWVLGLVVLYRLCLWYANLKQKSAPDSIWRFF